MSEKVKVLYFVDRLLRGGIQTFVYENIKHMDRNKVQIDFLLLDDGNKYEMEDDLKELGCNIYKLKGMWINKVTDFFKYGKMLDEFFSKNNDYKVVHLHSSSKNYLVLKYAKKYNIKVRIAHSHNIDFQTKNILKKLMGDFLKIPLKRYATDYFACSEIAGEWLFGKKIVKSDKFKVVHNAVDLEKFKFNNEIREKIRKELNVDSDTLLIGHVGRFTQQKNHDFLIDIFNEIHKINQNTKLLLIGTGIKENEIKEKVKSLNLQDSVIFEGFKTNVDEYMFAMDIFLFPSNFEGLGLVLIEAQAAGLPCYTSKDVVPTEAKVSNLLHYISLNNPAQEGAKLIFSNSNCRLNVFKSIKDFGYDIEDTSLFLQKFYLRNGENDE